QCSFHSSLISPHFYPSLSLLNPDTFIPLSFSLPSSLLHTSSPASISPSSSLSHSLLPWLRPCLYRPFLVISLFISHSLSPSPPHSTCFPSLPHITLFP